MSNLTPIRELIETLWNVNDDANVNDIFDTTNKIRKYILSFNNIS